MKFLLAALFISQTVASFDVYTFLDKYCIQTASSLHCKDFNWSQIEINDIQSTKFSILYTPYVIFENCSMGIFNENFVNKFPTTGNMMIKNCIVDFLSSSSSISEDNKKLMDLKFYNSTIFNSENSAAFKRLVTLTTLELISNKGLKNIDDTLLKGNRELSSLIINGTEFHSMSVDALANHDQLVQLEITGTSLKQFVTKISLSKLDDLRLSRNLINAMPKPGLLPAKTLKSIDLSHNFIQVVNDVAFSGLTLLNEINLSTNEIYVWSPNTLKYLTNLRKIFLHKNRIQIFEKLTFNYCKQLRIVTIYGNRLTNINNELFDTLYNLEELVIDDYFYNSDRKFEILDIM